jgi:hypothetical protein
MPLTKEPLYMPRSRTSAVCPPDDRLAILEQKAAVWLIGHVSSVGVNSLSAAYRSARRLVSL